MIELVTEHKRNKFIKKRESLRDLIYDKCPECSNPILILDNELGEILCKNCGLVATSNSKDRKPEWRAFTMKEQHACAGYSKL